MSLQKLTISELLDAYSRRTLKPSEVVQSYLNVLAKSNPTLNAVLQVDTQRSLARAKQLDSRESEIAKLPLYGVPIVIKDNILVEGWQATAGSKILENYRSPYTATCVERLENAGAVVIGKANCDEFAMGSSNEHSAYGAVKNPWDISRVPGGSSGGSAAAVAAQMCLASLGSDTGGSIRQPASLCGVVGLKPTYGRVSRYGVIAYASSLDQVGPLARNVWDASRVFEVMAGCDGHDSTTSAQTVPRYTELLKTASMKNVVVGVARDWLEGVEGEVKKTFDESLELMVSAGAKLVDVTLPSSKHALATYYIIAPCEASSNLARFDGIHYGFRSQQKSSLNDLYCLSRGEAIGAEVKLRIMLGTYALSSGYYDAYYLKANRVRSLIQKDFEKAFTQCSVMAIPTSPTTAFVMGEKSDDPIQMYLSDIFTLPINLAGIPGISVPCGKDKAGLPIGLQFIGKHFDEATLLNTAHSYEKVRGQWDLPQLGVV